MKKFSYVAKDTSGKTIKGIYEAEDAQEVLDKIHEQGLFCISYSEALGGAGKQFVHKFNTKELAFCCRQLAGMMTSVSTLSPYLCAVPFAFMLTLPPLVLRFCP